jgi:glucans biosynthesis protein
MYSNRGWRPFPGSRCPSKQHSAKVLPCALLGLALCAWTWAATANETDQRFGFETVLAKARQLAHQDYTPPPQIPKELKNLGYDEYRAIRFRPEKTLWRRPGMNFDVQLFHTGLYYEYPVTINIYDAEGVHTLPFSKDLFSYDAEGLKERIPDDAGFAGFVINYPLKRKDLQSQVIVFAGASYFRALGQDNVYGLSARGLAIDTALPSGEEFPVFTEFWLERPSPKARGMRLYALLDSRRVTGAYRFIIWPGKTTVVEVKANLFERESVAELGIAPLTSMFLYGEELPRPQGYWRPEVHDSDGLLMRNGTGEWIWRPLANEKRLRVSMFSLEDPGGFGLMQRDREFVHYEDLETRTELRPSAWVVPLGRWGKGQVKLTEIPSDREINDNIVVYWLPQDKPQPGEPIDVEYQIRWGMDDPHEATTGGVSATRIGDAEQERTKRFVLDFIGGELNKLAPDVPVQGVLSVGKGGKILEQQVHKNPVTGGWRLVFVIKTPKNEPVELRAYLAVDDSALTETWSYLLEP